MFRSTRVFALTLIMAFVAAAPTAAGSITPVTDLVTVLVVARAEGLPAGRLREMQAQGADNIAIRKAEAVHNARGILSFLQEEAHENPGSVRDIEVLWVGNSVTCRTTREVLRRLSRRTDVEAAVEDTPVQFLDPVSRRTARTRASSWSLEKVRVKKVWDDLGVRGQGVLIGHIDTGADANHPDLKGKIIRFKDFTKIFNPPRYSYDDEGHGTHVAGTIAGGPSIGMAPGARLIVAKALDKKGAGGPVGLIRALQWMVTDNAADRPTAVCNSWGAQMTRIPVVGRVFWASVSSLRDANILPVFAAGNSGEGVVDIPGAYPHSFAIGATTSRDGIASFSGRGEVKWGFTRYIKPDVSAPGSGIYSARAGGGYTYMSGTSMATPLVTGLAALVKSANPALKANEIQSIIEASALDLGETGRDATFGHGRVDSFAAVSVARKRALLGLR